MMVGATRTPISAQRVDVDAELGEVQQHGANSEDREHDVSDQGKPAAARQMDRERSDIGIKRRVDRDRFRRDQEGGATRQKHAGERDDKSGHLEIVNHGSHRRAKQQTDHEDQSEGDQGRNAQAPDRDREEYRSKADHRADRKVDTAGNNDEGHADGNDAEKGIIGEKVGDDSGRKEVRKLQRAENEPDDEYSRRDQNGQQTAHQVVLFLLRK
jgi:hypothetical protein